MEYRSDLGGYVSILILVDQSLEPLIILIWIRISGSFNPYFSGSVTGTGQELWMNGFYETFQSLF